MTQARILRVGRTCVTILPALLVASLAFAGAPSPQPEMEGPHTPEHQLASLGSFRFASGETIDDLKVSFVARGKLNAARDNAVLVLQPCSAGDHHGLDYLIGTGKALDPEQYFVISTDFLANSRLRTDVTTGPTNSGLKMLFPRITPRDWVNADHKLLKEYLGLDHILAVIGVSCGGINAYQFAVSYPDFMDAIVPIVGTPRTNPQTQVLLHHIRDVVALDAAWYGGMYEVNPTTGLELALMEIIPWFYSYEWYAAALASPDKVRDHEKFWRHVWGKLVPEDARDLYYQLGSWAEFNLGDSPGFNGDTRAALASIKARTLVIGIKEDMLMRREEMLFAKEAIHGANYVEISSFGHIGCCGQDPKVVDTANQEISKFLTAIQPRVGQ